MDNLDLSPYLTEREKNDYRKGNYAWIVYWALLECWRLCEPEKYEKRIAYHKWIESVFDDCDKRCIDLTDFENYTQLREWVISICREVYEQFQIRCVHTFWYLYYA